MKNSKKSGIIFFIMILFLTLSLRYIYLIGPRQTMNTSSDNTYITVNIRPGASGRSIASLLYQNDLIRSEFLFNILHRLGGESLKAGTYEISKGNDMYQIIDILVKARVATFRFTIPEGYTIEEIAKTLASLSSYSEDDFLQAANQDMGREYLREGSISRKYLLEGFLYPDTYIVPRDFTAEQILEHMLSQFEGRWFTILENNNQYKNGENRTADYTPFQIMTIASLIEKEVRLDREKTWVAAVIYNRLEQNMLLQLDASVQYVLADRQSRLLYRDLEVDSFYNTYRHAGLPPGPIANPGSRSIQAALNPADLDYLFYFARSDGSHVFSHSYSEHLRLQNEVRN